jgi:hypothetical protein
MTEKELDRDQITEALHQALCNSKASHLMTLSNDFNPNNLSWEDLDINKGRIACSARYRLIIEFEKAE